jgi:hypothetical protein
MTSKKHTSREKKFNPRSYLLGYMDAKELIKSSGEKWEKEYWNLIQEIHDGKHISYEAILLHFIRNLLSQQRHDHEILVNTMLDQISMLAKQEKARRIRELEGMKITKSPIYYTGDNFKFGFNSAIDNLLRREKK